MLAPSRPASADAAADNAATVREWFIAAERCAPRRQPSAPLAVTVFGFDPEPPFGVATAEALKRELRGLLLGSLPGAITVANPEAALRIAREKAPGTRDRAEIGGILARATNAEMVVFIEVVRLTPGHVEYALVGMSGESVCARTTRPLTYSIPTTQPQSLERVVDGFLDRLQPLLSEGDDGAATIGLCEVSVQPYRWCNGPLTDYLKARLGGQERPGLGRRVTVRAATAAECAAGGSAAPVVIARFAPIERGGTNGSMQFVIEARRGGATLVSTAPAEVSDLPPGCDLARRPRTLAEEILEGARRDPAILEVTSRGAFRVNDFVRVGIHTGRDMRLYCVAVDADETANVLMPSPGTQTHHKPRGDWTYRESFGGDPVQFTTPGQTLFGCLGVPGPPSAELSRAWLDAWCEAADGTTIGRTLDKSALRALLDKTRRAPDVVESYTSLVVSGSPARSDAAVPPQCARPVHRPPEEQ